MLPEDPEEPSPGEGIEEPPCEPPEEPPCEPPDAPPDGILEPPPPDCPPEEGMLEELPEPPPPEPPELPELPEELPEEPPEPPEDCCCCSGQPPIRNAAATPIATSLLAGSRRLRKSVCIVTPSFLARRARSPDRLCNAPPERALSASGKRLFDSTAAPQVQSVDLAEGELTTLHHHHGRATAAVSSGAPIRNDFS